MTLRRTLLTFTAVALLAASPALAGGPRAQSATGDVTSGPTRAVFDAKRPAGKPSTAATGTFTGRATVAGNQVIEFSGPVTCLDVRGDRMGLFYPVKASDPAAIAAFGPGVFIYVTSDGKGRATGFGFVPSQSPTTTDCAPMPAPAPASGKVALRS